MDACNHFYPKESWWNGSIGVWVEHGGGSAVEDIDLHRAKCRRCGEIMYYSGAAQRHYEEGEDNIVAESIRRGHNEQFIRNHGGKE